MSDPEPLEAKDSRTMPGWLLTIPLIYVILLLIAVLVYGKIESVNILGLVIPTSVIWFGTLGGFVASLQGIFFYNKKWDDSFTIWHIFAGVIGAAYGLASYLFLLVMVKAGGGSNQPANSFVFALAAFAIGYGQSNFHAMMDHVFKIIFHQTKSSDETKKSTES